MVIPGIGRIVHYRLSASDIEKFLAGSVIAGEYYPAMVIRSWPDSRPDSTAIDLQVFTGGAHLFSVRGALAGDGDGQWTWPPR
jgi:hypothetical protein